MKNAFESIAQDVAGFGSESKARGKFFLYEPWDIQRRSDSTLAAAEKDGVDLDSPKMLSVYGPAPRPFQSAIHLGEYKEQIFIGPTKGGKTLAVFIEVIIEASHLVPVCMQYDKGVDTGVKREIDPVNISRWGRRRDGVLLDYDECACTDGTWDCGNIIGIGKYPVDKFAPPGEKFWVLTTKEALTEKWWPDFKNSAKTLLPKGVIDTARGNNGFNEVDRTVFLTGQRELHLLSYEMGESQFEATDLVWLLIFDEEPYSQQMWVTGLTHANRVILIETPYNGMTWTGEKEFLKRTENRRCYHATAYDSPYIGQKKIDQWRESMAAWQIEARIWAMHSAQKGRPYFNRDKILKWIRNEDRIHTKAILAPVKAWIETHELMAGEIQVLPVREDDRRQTWEIYERPREGVPYLIAIDTSLGAPDPAGAGDNQVALVTRPPDSGDGTDPVIVAACRSTMEVIPFSAVVLNCARYFNNATLCPESPSRGASNATFYAYIKSWPFFFRMAITSDATGVAEDKDGFATGPRTRTLCFEIMADYIARHNVHSGIPFEFLLRELAATEWVSKNGHERPDHPRSGSIDCVTAFGMSLFAWKFGRQQMQCNGRPGERQAEKRSLLGLLLERVQEQERPRGRNPFSDM